MANKKKFDAVYSGDKYTNNQGEEKTDFINIGAAFENDKGQLSIKLKVIPVGFTGWINLYPPKEDNEKQAGRAQQAANQARGGQSSQRESNPFPEDD